MNKERAGKLVDSGIWLRLTGDLQGARGLFEEALKLDPQNRRAVELLALEPEPSDEKLTGVVRGTAFAVEPLPLPRSSGPSGVGSPPPRQEPPALDSGAPGSVLPRTTMIFSSSAAVAQLRALEAQGPPQPPPLPKAKTPPTVHAPPAQSSTAQVSTGQEDSQPTLVPFFTDTHTPSEPLPHTPTAEPLSFVTETPVPASAGRSAARPAVLGSPASAPRTIAPSRPALRHEQWAPPAVAPLTAVAPPARTTKRFGGPPAESTEQPRPAPPSQSPRVPSSAAPASAPPARTVTPFGADRLMQTTLPFGANEVAAVLRAADQQARRSAVKPMVIRLDLGDSLPEPKSIVDALRDEVDAKGK